MFEHLDDPRPPEAGPETQAAVARRAGALRRRRRRAIAGVAAAAVALVVAVAVAGLGSSPLPSRETAFQFDSTAVVGADAPVPTTALEDVVFVDARRGFGLADHRGRLVLATSADGGATWTVVTADLPYAYLESGQVQMEFTDPAHGYLWDPTGAVAAQPMWFTADGGRTWTRAPIPGAVADVSAIGSNVWALSQQCGHAGGPSSCPPVLDVSTDDGATWAVAPGAIPVGTGSVELARITVDRAYVLSSGIPGASSSDQLAYTADDGTTWTALPVPCQLRDGAELAASGTLDVWMICGGQPSAGSQAKQLFRSSDGGEQWTLAASSTIGSAGSSGNLLAAGYVAPVAIGHKTLDVGTPMLAWLQPYRGNVLVTRDGGRDWSEVPSLVAAGFGAGAPGNLTFISDTEGWVCELGVGLWHTDNGQDWQPLGA